MNGWELPEMALILSCQDNRLSEDFFNNLHLPTGYRVLCLTVMSPSSINHVVTWLLG